MYNIVLCAHVVEKRYEIIVALDDKSIETRDGVMAYNI